MRDQRWDALGEKIDPSWGPQRERSARTEIERRATQRRTAVRWGASGVALVLVAGGVTQLLPETVLEPMPERHGRGFSLRSGGARFTVPHDGAHPFVVVAG